jgi:hypothetical protein
MVDMMVRPALAKLEELHRTLEPTRWVLLRRAANRPLFRAEEALPIARAEANFKGSETTARFHATWLKKRGYLSTTRDAGRLAYRITTPGRHIYDHVAAILGEEPSRPIWPGTESRILAVIASVTSNEYDVLTGEIAEFDLTTDLRQGLESVLAARGRIRVEPEGS